MSSVKSEETGMLSSICSLRAEVPGVRLSWELLKQENLGTAFLREPPDLCGFYL